MRRREGWEATAGHEGEVCPHLRRPAPPRAARLASAASQPYVARPASHSRALPCLPFCTVGPRARPPAAVFLPQAGLAARPLGEPWPCVWHCAQRGMRYLHCSAEAHALPSLQHRIYPWAAQPRLRSLPAAPAAAARRAQRQGKWGFYPAPAAPVLFVAWQSQRHPSVQQPTRFFLAEPFLSSSSAPAGHPRFPLRKGALVMGPRPEACTPPSPALSCR